MEKEKHIKIHKELHTSLDKLVADYIFNQEKGLGETSVMELIKWSYQQTINPVDKEEKFTCPCDDDNCPKTGEYDFETDHIEDCPCKQCHIKLG